MKLAEKLEYLYFNKIIKPILRLSKLGRTTMKGEADSGLNIDHMYRKRPKGITKIGKLVDNILLNLQAVKATRYKKEIIIKILQNEVANNIILGRNTRVLDVGSGPARYLIELLERLNKESLNKVEILCADSDKYSVHFGRVLAVKKPIRYVKTNVFKMGRLKSFSKKISWIPNVIVSTGFFELQQDSLIKEMIKEVHKYLDKDGLFLFTNLLNNPNKKLMEKIGKKQDGKSWTTYFRKPEQLRLLLLENNFRDVIISVDRWGIYEYCTGRK